MLRRMIKRLWLYARLSWLLWLPVLVAACKHTGGPGGTGY